MIGVLDLKISNLSSVVNALAFLGIEHAVLESGDRIAAMSHIILPGVGTFAAGMNALEQLDFKKALLRHVVENGKPVLGICLGMQLLFQQSEESPGIMGLGVVPGTVRMLPRSGEYKVPRIGWAASRFQSGFLTFQQGENADFYYLHSYQAVPDNSAVITITSGEETVITAGIRQGNIFGVQFHPEKSHKAGLKLLQGFAGAAS